MNAQEETFAQYLQRKQFEAGYQSEKKVKLKDFAEALTEKVGNPLLQVKWRTLRAWMNKEATPSPEVQAIIRQALGA